jgi:hypothetical protein
MGERKDRVAPNGMLFLSVLQTTCGLAGAPTAPSLKTEDGAVIVSGRDSFIELWNAGGRAHFWL